MLHPWYLEEGWQKKAARYNITQGTPQWNDFVATVNAFQRNSFRVPCLAGFAILGIFGVIVMIATFRNNLLLLTNRSHLRSESGIALLFRKNISLAPLFGHKHSSVFKLISSFVTFQAPLRGETALILGLFIANLIPLVAFYTPFTRNNIYYPGQTFYQVGRYMSDRAGILAISQLPLVVLLSGRNNPVSLLTGASFSTCMLYHRWVARLVTLQVLVHAIGYSVISVNRGGIAKYKSLFTHPYLRWGVSACIFFVFLCFFSMRWFRQRSYDWFVLTHVAFAIGTILGVFHHIKLLDSDGSYADFINYTYVSIAFWVFDKVVRGARVFYLNGFCRNGGPFCSSRGAVCLVPGTDNFLLISLEIKGHAAQTWLQVVDNISSGVYVQVWIPRVHPLSSHPFTVACIETESKTCARLQLYVKVRKGITQRLLSKVLQNGGQCELSMMLEGLYGQQVKLPPSHSLILVAGGIGITSTISYLQNAIRQRTEAHLIWLVSRPDIITVLVDAFKNMEVMDVFKKGMQESICKQTLSIYITRPMQSNPTPIGEKDFAKKPLESIATLNEKDNHSPADTIDIIELVKMTHPQLHVQVHPLECRPSLKDIVQPFIVPKQTSLLCCGPAEMLDTLQGVSRQYDIDYHEEPFAW